jgi:hypothetical protein
MAGMEAQINIEQTQVEAQKDLQKEQAQFEFNIEEEINETDEFIKRERARQSYTHESRDRD